MAHGPIGLHCSLRRSPLRFASMSSSSSLLDSVKHEECWPDWVRKGETVVDDVSRLNATKVARVYQPRSIEDVQRLVLAAKEKNQTVCIRGTKHSMGGHTMSIGAVVLDMEYVTEMELNSDGSVTVGTGAKWADLIQYLNKFGKAPRTLQSYCSFSIGGTLSVNGHGITTDHSLSESVLSFRLVRYDGSIVECSRTAESEEARELFRCVLGGYGLFGIVYDVKLRTNSNVRLFMDTMMVPLNELPHLYEGFAQTDDIEVKLARINITTFEVGQIYIFRRFSDTPTVSNLTMTPTEMSNSSRMMYKWFAGPLRELRFAVEQQLGVALDWSEVVDRNLLLYESAEPLARLYSPVLLVDDTFILQEYFVPRENFNSWIAEAKKIVVGELNHETLLTLLNITIRVVERDADSMLPYSAAPGGSYAFVFYYRLRRTPEAIQRLATFHDKLTNITLAEGGTFYLPYQHHYSKEQLLAAYPGFNIFCDLKRKYDPESRFSNLWWEHYALDRTPSHVATFATLKTGEEIPLPIGDELGSSGASDLSSSGNAPEAFDLTLIAKPAGKTLSEAEITALFNNVSTRRTDSFRALMRNPYQRKLFLEIFLTQILSIGNNTQIFRHLNRAVWDHRLKDDDQIYMSLVDGLNSESGPIASLVKTWKNVRQLSDQKKELVRETVSVLSRLGRFGSIHNMVSVGDHGKLVVRLRTAMKMKGHVWVVHDRQGDESDAGAILERGSHSAADIGEYVSIDYEHIRKDGREFAKIPDGVVDLVTMNQGLHHLHPAQVRDFLISVRRILRPGGLFITREHDLDEKKTLMPMIDCAHMVFNALTGVTPALERSEIRGFRSVLEWRTLVESCGFRDSLIYEIQPNDPTKDIMLTFIKVEDNHDASKAPSLRESAKKRAKFTVSATDVPTMKTLTDPLQESIQLLNLPPSIATLAPNVALNQLPRIGLAAIKTALQYIQQFLPNLQDFLINTISKFVPAGIPGLTESVKLIINNYVAPALMMLSRFEPLTDAAVPNPDFAESYLPEEIYLLVQLIRARSKQGGIIELAIISIIDKVLDVFLGKKKKDKKEVAASPNTNPKSSPSVASSSSSLPRNESDANLAGSASPSALAEAAEIPEDEVTNELKLLFETYPELYDLKTVIANLGLSANAASLLNGMAPSESSPERFTTFVLTKLDKYSWNLMKDGIIRVRKDRKLPTMELINSPVSGWNRLFLGIFSSPSIQLSASQRFMAKMAGLGDIVNIWNLAQETRQKQAASGSQEKPSNRLPTPAANLLADICPAVIYEGKKSVLTNVLSVVSARWEKSSVTRLFNQKFQDVTAAARLALQSNGTLDLNDIPLDKTLLRGEEKFVVEYRQIPDVTRSVGSVRKMGVEVAQLLASSGHLDSQLHADHENLTFYKLSEWMQVELVQLFGDFMHHTPWYRFPFMDMFKIYASVLYKTVNVVAEKGGFMAAIADQGFMIDAVPGVVMAILFGQMQLLALPVLASLGDSYDPTKLVEQLLVMVPGKLTWAHVDRRIVPLTEFDQGISVLQVPTFKPFTEVLTNIALHVPGAVLLQVSNYSTIHVKLEVESKRAEALSKQFATVKGVTVNFDFKYPAIVNNPNPEENASKDTPVFISITVQLPALFNFIRRCHNEWKGAKIFQIYDFF